MIPPPMSTARCDSMVSVRGRHGRRRRLAEHVSAIRSKVVLVTGTTCEPQTTSKFHIDQPLDPNLITREEAAAIMRRSLGSSAESWFTNIVSITNVEVGDPLPQVSEGNGMSGYAQGVQVLTHFDVEQRTVVSMHNGATSGVHARTPV